jgi:membrane dipeptidase
MNLTKEQEERALRLHHDSLVVDTHNDTIQDIMSGVIPHAKEYSFKRRLGERSIEGQIDLPRLSSFRDGCFAWYV